MARQAVAVQPRAEVPVAVLDTGVDYTHPDLAGNMWHRPADVEMYVDRELGVVDDYNGYSAVEGERDLGASVMWNSAAAKQHFRDLTGLGLKGSGDYGMVAVGAYSGQGLNRPDQNGDVHVFGRVSYPFKLASGQYVELGVQGYSGRFVSPSSDYVCS